MSRGVNKVILIGNVGRDPEIRFTQSQSQVANVSLATSRKWKDQSGQYQDETEWHRLVAFGKTAELIGQYVKKGTKLFVEGRLQTRKWTDKDGQDKYTTEIVVNEMNFLGDTGDGSGQSSRQQQAQPAPAPAPQESFDEDIPF